MIDHCCQIKNVWGAENPIINGFYRLVGKSWNIPRTCSSPCVYVKMKYDMEGYGGMSGMEGYGMMGSAMGEDEGGIGGSSGMMKDSGMAGSGGKMSGYGSEMGGFGSGMGSYEEEMGGMEGMK